ncbi:MAG: VTT domain-containing protein [Clostridia bacterium]|nr:VTT domain-containing protein [Clostridia bacterium]
MQNQEKSIINLLVTIDKKYLSPLITMLISYGENHKTEETHVYVAHSSLDTEDFAALNTQIRNYPNIHIHSIKITESWFKDTPVLERLPEESFYRVLAFHYLPESVDKCLYLDPDIYILKNLSSLYETDLEGYYAAAASHVHGFINLCCKIRLGLKQERYINSGVMLMNMEAIRRDFTVPKVLEALEKYIQRLLFGDQDLLNLLFDKKILYIDETIYNLDEKALRIHRKTMDLQAVKEKTAIIHYNGKYKPWLTGYEGSLAVFYPRVEKTGEATRGTLKNQAKAFRNILQLSPQQKKMLRTTFFLLITCLALYFFFGKEMVQAVQDPQQFKEWLSHFGVFDEIIFILIRTVQTIVKVIPALPLEIGAGYAWGAWLGMLYCLIGNILGTFIVLWLIKNFGTKLIEKFFSVKNLKFLHVLQSSKRLHWMLFFVYLIPIVPKDAITYFVSFLPVKTGPFLFVTTLARIPAILVVTLSGAALAQENYMLSGTVFVATLVIGLVGTLLCFRKPADKKTTAN